MVENQNIMLTHLLLLSHASHGGESESNVKSFIATEAGFTRWRIRI